MRLNHKLLPMIDYHKAKDLMWDPRHLECEQAGDQFGKRLHVVEQAKR